MTSKKMTSKKVTTIKWLQKSDYKKWLWDEVISVCFYQVKTVSVRDYDFLKNLSEVKLVQC